MKREILFRGKRRDTGEWIYGGLMEFNGDTEICDYNTIDCSRYDVIPETVGQFTGLTDKNGMKIFEGDIIKFKTTRYHTKQQAEKGKAKPKWFMSPVLFSEGEFVINEESKIHLNAIDYDTYFSCCFNCKKGEDFEPEVIGNIDDNTELAK